MAINVSLGSVSIAKNSAVNNPLNHRPSNAADVYAAFEEVINTTAGLVATVFQAMPPVASRNNHSLAKIKWPSSYGTNERPYGRPADPTTGEREERCEGEDWVSAIQGAAQSRLAMLEYYRDFAVAIGAGIKAGIENTFKTTRATLGGTTTTVSISGVTSSDEVFVQRRTAGTSPGTLLAVAATDSVVITSSSSSDNGEVSILVVKG